MFNGRCASKDCCQTAFGVTGNIGQPFGANACFALRVVSLDGGLVCVVRCQAGPWFVEG